MALDHRTTPYGTPALTALRAVVDELQEGHPLTPVTVLVHSNAVGVAARRWLAAHGGVAAAQFITTFRLAELLGGPALVREGRRPVSTPVIEVAARGALARSEGLFAPIAAHQATVAALRSTYRELRHVPDAAWGVLAGRGSARAKEVVRLCRSVQHRLAGEWYDEADLLRAAATACQESLAEDLRRTVVFLPQRMRATERALLEALAVHGQVVVLEGQIGLGAAGAPSPAVEVVDTSDADEEVREAVRLVVAAAHRAVPLHRVAIAWPHDTPYARLVAEHLDDAALPWNGRPGTSLRERLAARLVLDVFRLDRKGIRRADLFALLAHVPARLADGTPVPRQHWERIARDAGLAGDRDWGPRLDHFTTAARAGGREADAEAAASLQAFVAGLRTELGSPDGTQRWAHWAEVAQHLLTRWLGGQRGIAALPENEVDAYHRVQAALDRVSRLDPLTGPVTRAVVAETLEAELDSAPGRVGRIGVGVQAGPLAFAVGQEVDLLIVLGACEGSLPAPPPAEALLSDHDRALTGGELPLDADLTALQHDQLWAALAGAQRAVLLWPRGDLRATAARQVSRWVAELEAASLTDARRAVASFAAGLAEAPFPATATQHRVRALVNARARGEDPAAHPLVAGLPALRLGAAMVAARGSAALTEYDGDLSAMDFDPLGDRPASPTRLEAWVACPHAWFLQHVLGVEPVEQPDEQLQITPRDRGTLVHDALDLFHREVLAGHVPPPGPTGWGPEHEAALLAAFEKVAADLAHLGLVGRRAFWHSEHTRQRRELQDWMAHDSELLVQRGATVVASELRFGVTTPEGQEVPAATIDLGDGTALRFRGSIDRVDRCADGRLVVTDHKTGSDSHYRDITEADPTAGGSRLQLVVYAAAARAVTDVGPDTPVLAEYSFLGRGGFKRIGVTMDASNQPAAQAAVAGIVHGIRSRLFVALPEKAQYQLSWVRCPWCDPDGLGTAERWQEFERKQADPRVAALLGLDTDAATDAPDGPAEAPQ